MSDFWRGWLTGAISTLSGVIAGYIIMHLFGFI